jgi:hypothetical protein
MSNFKQPSFYAFINQECSDEALASPLLRRVQLAPHSSEESREGLLHNASITIDQLTIILYSGQGAVDQIVAT